MTTAEIMDKVSKGELTAEQATALLNKKKLSLKVSTKGAVQLDGLRRFPVTLYRDEWTQVLDMADDIRNFIKANASKLTEKSGNE